MDDHLEESFAQFEFDLNLDMIHEQAKALLDPTLEIRTENREEVKDEHLEQVEHREQIEPSPEPSNDKEVSTEAHSFIIIPLESQHEPQASFFQCLEEPSYVEIFKESHTRRCKYRKRSPKKILLSNKVSFIRWRNILLEGYHVLMKKGWKGLVGHPCDRGKCGILFFFFSPHFIFESFYFVILFLVILFYF